MLDKYKSEYENMIITLDEIIDKELYNYWQYHSWVVRL